MSKETLNEFGSRYSYVLAHFQDKADLTNMWNQTNSIVIARHPMARLSSLYFSVKGATYGWWYDWLQGIKTKYPENNETEQAYPSPNQFLR